MTASKPRSGALLIGIYVLATGLGAVTVLLSPWTSLLVNAAVASLVATLVVFGAGALLGNASAYDPYWSVAPPVLAAWWVLAEPSPRGWLGLALTLLWGIRLTASFWRGWPGFGHEDWRYRDLRAQTGVAFPLVNLFGIHLFPTVCTFAGSLPLLVVAGSSAPLSGWDVLAAVVAIGSTTIEAIADTQLHRFKAQNHPPGTILESGLWRWSRHPNYFGEIGFWWGIALLGVAAGGPTPWWNFAGAILISLLFIGISIPLIERRMAARRPNWSDYCRRVSVLVPLPPRR